MKSAELRKLFLNFFKKHGHNIVASSSLLPNDPSVLFTTAGMQQFKPYYTGDKDAMKDFGSLSTASIQKSMRTSDINEVGDESHNTFFEMLGNFSFGGYWKKEAITFAHDFLTKELGLEIAYITVFKGSDVVPKDEESKEIWKSLGVADIREQGMDDVFWGPTGNNGPCGPTTEIYLKREKSDPIENWNIVFNEFFCDGSREQLLAGTAKLTPLKIKGIDTGMGLERLAIVSQNVESIFETDLFDYLISEIDKNSKSEDIAGKRIIADHVRSSVFLISDGVKPSNTEQGYVLRRLLRRAIYYQNSIGVKNINLLDLTNHIIKYYDDIYPLRSIKKHIDDVIGTEINLFNKTLETGKKQFEKMANSKKISGKDVFILFSTYGFPIEMTLELARDNKININEKEILEESKKHQDLSRTASAGMFKGGLADEKPETIKLHTAHHLLLAVLQELFGKQVKQKGSNINSERLRIDFSFDRKLTDEEKKKIEDIVNDKIQKGLDVVKREMPKEEAEKIGAEMEFGVKYGDVVSVYFIKDKQGNIFSKEFCGGPHVKNTSELGNFKIIKEEASSRGVRRIKATLK